MSFIAFLGQKAAGLVTEKTALVGPVRLPRPMTTPQPAGGQPAYKPPAPGDVNRSFAQELPQRMDELRWLTTGGARPAHLGPAPGSPGPSAAPPAAPAARPPVPGQQMAPQPPAPGQGVGLPQQAAAPQQAGPPGWFQPGSASRVLADIATPSGLVNPQNWNSPLNPVGAGAAFGPMGGLGTLTLPALKRMAPGLASRIGGSSVGQFFSGPSAGGNLWNLARSVSPWAAGGTAPANVFAPGAMFGGAAPAAGTAGAGAGGTGAAGAAGTAGTGLAALYGAYVLGDLPYGAYQLATGQADLHQRSLDQMRDGNYLTNIGGNLLRPGLAIPDYLKGLYWDIPSTLPKAVINKINSSYINPQTKVREQGYKMDTDRFNKTIAELGSKPNLTPQEQMYLDSAQKGLQSVEKSRAKANSPFRAFYGY